MASEQCEILNLYVASYKKLLQGQLLTLKLFNIDGTAGSGKTYLIYTICHKLRHLPTEHNQPNPILVLAPSGVAALNGHGQTIHSTVALPVMGPFLPLMGFHLHAKQAVYVPTLVNKTTALLGEFSVV